MKIPATQQNDFAATSETRLRSFLWEYMKISANVLVLTSFFAFALNCCGQIICLSDDGCRQQILDYCKNPKKVPPNLTLAKAMRVKGVLRDPTGAVFAPIERGTIIQLREWETSKVLRSDTIRDDGSFELGLVQPGKYRLVIGVFEEGKIRSLHGFMQLLGTKCDGGEECVIAAPLLTESTDDIENFCDPR
jgi:hypothetical protein